MNLVGGWGAGVESWRSFTPQTRGASLSQLCLVGKEVGGTGSEGEQLRVKKKI